MKSKVVILSIFIILAGLLVGYLSSREVPAVPCPEGTPESCAIAMIQDRTGTISLKSIKFLQQRMIEPARIVLQDQPEIDYCVQIESMEAAAQDILRAVQSLRKIEMHDVTGASASCR